MINKKGCACLAIWKMYVITFIEIIIFLFIGFFCTEKGLSRVYESYGIEYSGNIGSVCFGISLLLFCLYTIVRSFISSTDSPLLKERITSFTFWIVFIWSVYSVFSPFIKGEI